MNIIQHELYMIEQNGTRFRATTTLGSRRIASEWHDAEYTAYDQLVALVSEAWDRGGNVVQVSCICLGA
jgi:hypothetical protein